MNVNKIIKSTVKTKLKITGATLLSVGEAEEYLTRKERADGSFWWLCSVGISGRVAFVDTGGLVDGIGYDVSEEDFAVRPALQIKNLESSNLKIGDIFEIGNYEFKIISDSIAWMYKQDIGNYAFNNDFKKGNDYETSDVKKIVDEWFVDLIFTENWFENVLFEEHKKGETK